MTTSKQSTFAALTAMSNVVIATFVVAVLYVGRQVLIPLALAALLTFLLAPVVTRIERWLGRVTAVLLTVAVLFGILSGLGWVMTRQAIDLAVRLPDYKENIRTKLRALQGAGDNQFSRIAETMEDLKKDLPGGEAAAERGPSEASGAAPGKREASTAPDAADARTAGLPKDPAAATPAPMEVVEVKKSSPAETLRSVLGPLVGPLGTGALVLLLVVCMLLKREDLRGRVLRLIGQGKISATTRAMDDAAERVARYLVMQLIINATYGLAVAAGLFFIGVPSAFVWGVLAAVLRFIPYIGPWIAAAFPIVLSLAVSNNWTMPLLAIGLFILLEILSNNVMEPWLYGSSTGVSSIALIIAAVFWTWLWGAAGLVLATPLTVCLAVMGRHVPRLGILAVLLSDEEALEPHEEFYHRLLTPMANDAGDFAAHYLRAHSLATLYDSVLLPALAIVERDAKSGEFESAEHAAMLEELADVIEDLGSQPVPERPLAAGQESKGDPMGIGNMDGDGDEDEEDDEEEDGSEPAGLAAAACRVVCLPVRAERDELAGAMLTQLLQHQKFPAENLSAKLTTGELIKAVESENPDAVCLSVVAPTTVLHARYLCGKLRRVRPNLQVVVGLWGAFDAPSDAVDRLREVGASAVVTTLDEAVAQVARHATAVAQESAPPGDSAAEGGDAASAEVEPGPPAPATAA